MKIKYLLLTLGAIAITKSVVAINMGTTSKEVQENLLLSERAELREKIKNINLKLKQLGWIPLL